MAAFVHHPDYIVPGPHGVRGAGKNERVRNLLLESGRAIHWAEPPPTPRRWLEAVHDPAYVEEVLAASVPAHKERRIGFAVTEAVARRAQRVPGGTWLAGCLALKRGFAANIAGGSHHALHSTGAGYCVFNDLAIAAVRLTEEGNARRVLIVDCDVHQGDGTAVLTAGRPAVATYSIHAEKNFPARKARSTRDVPLPDGTGDAAYLAALRDTLPPLVREFRPDLILYQAGVDPFAGDRLGRLALTQQGLEARDRAVARLARDAGIAIAATLGGGYGTDMAEVAARHVRTLLVLADEMEGSAPTDALAG